MMYINCAHLSPDKVIAAMEEMMQQIEHSGANKRTLVLMNMEATTPAMEVNQKGREIEARSRAIGIPEMPTAIFGFSTPQKVIARTFAMFRKDDTLYIADSEEDAKDWLVNKWG